MKKLILSALFLAFAGILAACGSSNNASDNKTITVAASKTPHAEILEEAKP
ncbi:methionine ABC transporter substrate-binding protein, partial [Bacillus altitudinis]|nr:methionine ABC transporter substrate-binding protein [Bacillus altitudinis]